ncbi:MAG TPA: nuclear transport factor 2 family protein [Chitinophagaceae bacterium]
MKRLLIAFVAVLFFYSCDNSTTVAGSEEDNMAARNTEHVKAIFKAIETGDVSAVDTLLTEDFIDHNANMDGSDIVGKDSVKAMLSKIHTYFDGLKVEYISDATSEDGTYHYALSRMTGTAKENPWGMPVGMKMDDSSVDVIKIRDGKAAEHWGFLSWGDINEMMKGMAPPAATDTTKK